MNLEQTEKLIQSCAEQMQARYNNRVVFDEWVIITLTQNKGRILAYTGPRKAGFSKDFAKDVGALKGGLQASEHEVGAFEFARHGVGTGFEAFMVLGKGVFLICNNTVQSMDGICRDPFWLAAQGPFVDLSEKIRLDPLELD
jgi:hypothetical protein